MERSPLWSALQGPVWRPQCLQGRVSRPGVPVPCPSPCCAPYHLWDGIFRAGAGCPVLWPQSRDRRVGNGLSQSCLCAPMGVGWSPPGPVSEPEQGPPAPTTGLPLLPSAAPWAACSTAGAPSPCGPARPSRRRPALSTISQEGVRLPPSSSPENQPTPAARCHCLLGPRPGPSPCPGSGGLLPLPPGPVASRP